MKYVGTWLRPALSTGLAGQPVAEPPFMGCFLHLFTLLLKQRTTEKGLCHTGKGAEGCRQHGKKRVKSFAVYKCLFCDGWHFSKIGGNEAMVAVYRSYAERKGRCMNMNTLQDRIRGSLIGGAIGDALGYPVEFMSRKAILRKYGDRGISQFELYKNGKALVSDGLSPYIALPGI